MAVTNVTQEFILQVVDANQEFNTKLILFGVIFAYLLALLYLSNKLIPYGTKAEKMMDEPVWKQFLVVLMRIPSYVLLFFMPLIIALFMYRDLALEAMTRYMVIGYSVMVMVALGIWFLYGMQWVLNFLSNVGIDVKMPKKIIRGRE